MPTITCPCCRAANGAGPNCRRCSTDLSLMFKLEDDRESLLATAGRHLADGRVAEALSLIAHAETLRPGPDVLQLRAVASLLNRDFTSALNFHHAATSTAK
ncbi:hypothetical protein [Limnoglobus roseus]|uniref:Tetratricopeptide repeat protein n=1 Tax=Limnoglobus roseus TaxID=2598579 RepID=A0A5C1ABJ7_9BACT|nr:hypothetical protein [Limnoglobus roseus]QEL15396.1 hypothetical protein PX52LOC_02315 [Limnoglobus roseus]